MNKVTNDNFVSAAESLRRLKEGNARFSSNVAMNQDVLGRIETTKFGQKPFAAILSCMDSRAPVELIFDQGIGDVFSIRIAGNIVSDGILGSLEYAVNNVGSRLIVVMGHTDCGAVKAACDGGAHTIKEGFIPVLLSNIQPAIDQAAQIVSPDHNSSNGEYVAKVTELNIQHSIEEIMKRSAVIRRHVEEGDEDKRAMIVAATYNVATGKVQFQEVMALA